MNNASASGKWALAGAEVRRLCGRFRNGLTPAVQRQLDQLLSLLAEDGTTSIASVHQALFPRATTSSAGAQMSRLVTTLQKAASDAGVVFTARITGSKRAGVGERKLSFTGPRPSLRAHLDALPANDATSVVRSRPALLTAGSRCVILVTVTAEERAAVLACFLGAGAGVVGQRRANNVVVDHLDVFGGLPVLHHNADYPRPEGCLLGDALQRAYSPLAIISVGTALGADRVTLRSGHVLVGTVVMGIAAADTGAPTGSRSEFMVRCPPCVEAAFRSWAKDDSPGDGEKPTLHFGPIFCEDRSAGGSTNRSAGPHRPAAVTWEAGGLPLRPTAANRGFIGVEEGDVGLYQPLERSGVPWAMVRAVHGWVSGPQPKNSAALREEAVAIAARLVRKLIESGRLRASMAAAASSASTAAGSGSVAATVVAFDDIMAWSQDADGAPTYAVVGDSGSGMTTLCQAVAAELYARRSQGDQALHPLYFDLRKVERVMPVSSTNAGTVPTLQETIEDCLRHGYLHDGGDPPRYADVLAAIDEGALIIFDGLDAVLSRVGEKQGKMFVTNLRRVLLEAAERRAARLIWDDGTEEQRHPTRLLVSCRKAMFRNLDEQRAYFGESRVSPILYDDPTCYREAVLQPLADSQVADVLWPIAAAGGSSAGPDPEVTIDKLLPDAHLHPLLRQPLPLQLVASLLAQSRQRKAGPVAPTQVCAAVAHERLIRDRARESLLPEDKWQAAEHLSAYLWKTHQTSLSAHDLERWLDLWVGRQDAHAYFHGVPRELVHADVRAAAFLGRSDTQWGSISHFSFDAPTLRDFFLASYLFRALRSEDSETARERWVLPKVTDRVLDLLGELLAEDRRQDLASRAFATLQNPVWRRSYRSQATELFLAYALRAHQKGWPVPSLHGIDLREATLDDWHFGNVEQEASGRERAPLLDLSEARFERCKLRRTRFYNVRLSGARFDSADAAQATFTGCRADGTVWRGARLQGSEMRQCALGPRTGTVQHPSADLRWVGVGLDEVDFVDCNGSPTKNVPDRAGAQGPLRLLLCQGHTSTVRSCAVSADMTRMATASEDGSLRLWSTVTGRCIATLVGHVGPVSSCAFSPDGSELLSGGDDGTLRLWSTRGSLLRTFEGHDGVVRQCVFAPNGRWLLSAGGDGALRRWDVASGRCLWTVTSEDGEATCCRIAPDGRWVVFGGTGWTASVLAASNGQRRVGLPGHAGLVACCAITSDGTRVVTGDNAGTLRIWNVPSGECVLVVEAHRGRVLSCDVAPNGRRMVSSSVDQKLCRWDADTGELLGAVTVRDRRVGSCVVFADSLRFAAAGSDSGVSVWDATSDDRLLTTEPVIRPMRARAVSEDGQWASCAANDGSVRIWDTAANALLHVMTEPDPMSTAAALSRSASGGWYVCGNHRGVIEVWDVTFRKQVHALASARGITCVAASVEHGIVIAGHADGTLRLWTGDGSQGWRIVARHLAAVTCCSLSVDGRWVVSGSDDKTVRLVDLAADGKQRPLIRHASPITACAVSTAANEVLTASDDGFIYVWQLSTGTYLRPLDRTDGHQGPVRCCAASSDGAMVLSGGDDATLRLWDPRQGKLLKVLQGHLGSVSHCAFGAAGDSLVSAGADNSVRVWAASSGACERIHHDVDRGAASWSPDSNEKVFAWGEARHSLRWRSTVDVDAQRNWPLEAAADAVEISPWSALVGH